MASCMADNDLECKVIGLIWDGTGYGTDGTIWGGECLIGDYSGFERFGSIRNIAMPGGDKAVKEIYRLAFSLMKDLGHKDIKVTLNTYCSAFDEYRRKNTDLVEEYLKKQNLRIA